VLSGDPARGIAPPQFVRGQEGIEVEHCIE
jgi:hypothetical protein